MAFQKHLFISYAHIDNEPLAEQEEGWVTRFHSSLAALLGMRLGRKAEIWRDTKLQGNDVFSDEIVEQFPQTALLVSVLSPRYVESEWCTREAREFCQTAESSGGLTVDNKTRVFKVIKTPVDSEDTLPPVMKQLLGYPFFVLDEGQTPVELDPAYGEDLIPQYNLKVAKLAFEMAQLIRKLDSANRATPAAPSAKPTVYLAESSYDRREHREALDAELRLLGYTVLPDRQMPRDELEYTAAVETMLAQCRLSIHLVGSNYGAVPDGPTDKSVVVLQNDLAIAQCRKGGLQRVIWLPENTVSESPLQQKFISALHSDAQTQYGADLIAAEFEVLKGAIHASLKRIENPAPAKAPAPESAGGKLIHLICDQRDRQATIPLRKFLRNRGHEVKIPLFEGAAAVVHQANHDLLAQCEAAILFYGAGDEAWKRTAETDIRKTKASREKPLNVVFTYLAGPVTSDKTELIELEEANLIQGFDEFSEAAMEPFLKALDGVR